MGKKTKTECPLCGGTGWIVEEKDGFTRAVRCRCFYQRQGENLLREAQVPLRFLEANFDNFDTKGNPYLDRAKRISQEFVENYPLVEKGLLFLGKTGVGKTHLLVSIISALVGKKGASCLYYDYRDLLRELQKSFSPLSEIPSFAVIEPALKTEVLVIDDLGSQRPTSWVLDTIAYIINHRYNENLITLAASNYLDVPEEEGEETLEMRIGASIRSRLLEMCRTVEIKAPDYREKLNRGRN
ncbi:MAG: ATP-binding protein [Acidobacteria bacterium]|nr:ATP-binding protein [Acidobacteriota bacterium]